MVAKQVRAAYTQEFRLEAVRLVQSGQSQMQVCQTLGIPKASLSSWVRQAKVGTNWYRTTCAVCCVTYPHYPLDMPSCSVGHRSCLS